jgi:late competence protein required for DNA uptake (superfamily II DNA/RNA helicase)
VGNNYQKSCTITQITIGNTTYEVKNNIIQYDKIIKMAKYKWNCEKCPSTIVHNEKEELNKLIAEFFCPICKEKKRICFKDLKENETK